MDVTIFLAPSSKRLFMGIAEHFEKSQLFEFWPFLFGSGLARLGKTNRGIQRGRGMKWDEIISLRCPGNTDTRFVDWLLKGVSESDSPTDTPMDLIEIKVFRS
jgi:hypothetical protein